MRRTIEQQAAEIDVLDADIDALTRRVSDLNQQLINWQSDEISVTNDEYIPFYYYNSKVTITVTTDLTEHFPAFVKYKNSTSYFMYVPDWTNSVWPSSQYDIGIINVQLQCSVYTKQTINYYTKTKTSEVTPMYQPNFQTIVPNYVQTTTLLTDGETWCYSKIRIRTPNGEWKVMASEKDHNWWWFETRNDIVDIE